MSAEEYENALTFLMGMGFPREQCIAAMRAAFNNADRAVEYLFSGIPEQPAQISAPIGSHPGMGEMEGEFEMGQEGVLPQQ